MLSPLRNRFGIPGVISVIALVFAMLGGAYAASNDDGGKATASAKAKPKAKRGPKGPKGATGPAGPAGPQGPAGANGKDGANGSNGSDGSIGAAGAPGQSVTATAEPPFGECGEQEGVKYHSVSGDNYVCNGVPGEDGQTGFTETLPSGKTEKGTWLVQGTETSATFGTLAGAISFNIPLATLPTAHIEGQPGFSTNCAGSVGSPTAASGHLCVYGPTFGLVFEEIQTDLAGAFIKFTLNAEPAHIGQGTWAVTG